MSVKHKNIYRQNPRAVYIYMYAFMIERKTEIRVYIFVINPNREVFPSFGVLIPLDVHCNRRFKIVFKKIKYVSSLF